MLADIKHARRPARSPFVCLDVRDRDVVAGELKRQGATHVHHLAAALSARGEKEPQWAWDLNMRGLLNVLEVAAEHRDITQVFWPSSIAVFGPDNGPVAEQNGHRLPETVYGISKQAGEQWCAWFRKHHGVDTRSVRYPGLIGELCPPGGGTTDYAVEVFDHLHGAEPYTCFLQEDTVLPMMHMQDTIRAMLQIASVEADRIRNKEAYNIQAMSFDPIPSSRKSAGMFRAPGGIPAGSDRPSPTVGRTVSTTPQPARTGADRRRSPCRSSWPEWSRPSPGPRGRTQALTSFLASETFVHHSA